ncbi:hypothetical protein AAC387_Pa10g1440 [Persea americana]
MSPSHFTDEHRMQIMNSPRPSILKINKDSHLIHKPSPSSTSLPPSIPLPPNRKQRQPIIIYTHPPKIIHTQPQNFMALVQKLTGMQQSEDSVNENHQVLDVGDNHLDRKHCVGAPSFQFVEEHRGVGDVQPNSFIYDAPFFTAASHYRYASMMEVLKPLPEE